MAKFQDSHDQTWTIELTIAAAKRVKRELEVDLLNMTDGNPPLISRLDTDLELLVDVISVLLSPQLTAAGLGPEDFAERLTGGVMYHARLALWEALSHFFQSLGWTHLVKAIETEQQLVIDTIEAGTAQIEAIDTTRLIESRMAGAPSTSSPASSGSSPTS